MANPRRQGRLLADFLMDRIVWKTFRTFQGCNGRTRVFPIYKKGFARLPVDGGQIGKFLEAMLDLAADEGRAICGVDLYVANDALLSRLNSEYLKCAGPTNIVSFPGGSDMRGTLFLSADMFFRECFLYGQDEEEYLLRLLGHGFGHLTGFEHGVDMDAFCQKCVDAARMAILRL